MAVSWKKTLPGRRVAVKIAGEKGWSERILLWPLDEDHEEWVVVTPDDAMMTEDMVEDFQDVKLIGKRGSKPTGVGTFYRFADELSDDDMRRLILKGKEVGQKDADDNDYELPAPKHWVNWQGD